MSVAVSQPHVAVMTSDQSSVCPPLCQLLGALCYSPALCSKKRLLTPHRAGAQTVLGALWIITALLHIGLGIFLIIISPYMGKFLYYTGYFPVWMAVLFLFFGMSCVLSEKNPRPLFVLLSALLNLAGVAMSIAAIALFSRAIDEVWYENTCSRPPDADLLWQRCTEARELRWGLMSSVDAVGLALFVLDLCLGLSSAIIGFKTLRRGAIESSSASSPLLKEAKGKS